MDSLVTEIESKLDPKPLVIDGFLEFTFPSLLPGDTDVVVRTLVPRQVREVSRDLRHYAEGKACPGGDIAPGDKPGPQEALAYQAVRELAEHVVRVGARQLQKDGVDTRVEFFDCMADHLVGIIYRNLQAFLVAVNRILQPGFPSKTADAVKK